MAKSQKDRDAKLHDLLQHGTPSKEIIEEMQITEDQLYKFKSRHGYSTPLVHTNGEIQAAILDADRSVRGWQSKVAADLGVSRQQISSAYKRMTAKKEL